MKHDFDSLRHPKAGVPSIRHIYRDAAGTPVVIANRFYDADGKKFFLPFDVERGEWKAPASRPIYNLDKISAANTNKPIIFVEGEKCADALSDLGYLTTTTFGGSKADKKSDLSPLAGRNVVLWPDHDDPGLSYTQSVSEVLYTVHTVNARIIPINAYTLGNEYVGANSPTYPKGWDGADAIAEGWGNEQIDKLIALALPYAPESEAAQKPEPVDLDAMVLWHTPDKEGFATLNIDGHFENWSLASSGFRDFLSYHHFQTEGKMLSQTALEEKRRTLLGEARFLGGKHKVFHRIAEQERCVYLDLGTDDWKAVAIDAAGWQILDRPPVRFRRSNSMEALPLPVSGMGDIDLLRPFLNVGSEADQGLYQNLLPKNG